MNGAADVGRIRSVVREYVHEAVRRVMCRRCVVREAARMGRVRSVVRSAVVRDVAVVMRGRRVRDDLIGALGVGV